MAARQRGRWSRWDPRMPSALDGRSAVDFVNGRREGLVEGGVVHRRSEIADQGAREARKYVLVGSKMSARVGARVATRKRHHTMHPRMLYQVGIKIRRIASAAVLPGVSIRTSGSMIGNSACRTMCSASSNCCPTKAAMPFWDGRLIADRILVPNTPHFTARFSSASSAGIGVIRRVPSRAVSSPLSTLRKGTMPRCSQRNAGTGSRRRETS